MLFRLYQHACWRIDQRARDRRTRGRKGYIPVNKTLTLERREQEDKSAVGSTPDGGMLAMTPPIGGDYWAYRVMLSDKQAIVGFPKFFTIGIGFAVEEDWNSNLPSSCEAEDIFAHIAHNKGDESISDEDCIAAIRLIQRAATEDRA